MVNKFILRPIDLGEDILLTDEKVIVESRPLIWPHLFEPVITMVAGITLVVLVRYFEQKYVEFDYWHIAGWVALAVLIIGIISVLIRWLRWRYTVYALTNKRILRRTGVLGRSYLDCSLSKVQNVEVRMSALSRMFKFGTVKVATARTKGDDIEWIDIKDPLGIQRQINESLERFIKEDD